MPTPVVIVTANGRPITNVSGGVPMTPVEASVGGEPVILVDSGGEPVTLVNADLSLWNATLTELRTRLSEGRVDFVGIGDSNQILSGHGWDHGFQYALAQVYPQFATDYISFNENNSDGNGRGYLFGYNSSAAVEGVTTGAPAFFDDYLDSDLVTASGHMYGYLASGTVASTNNTGGMNLNGAIALDVTKAISFDYHYGTFATGSGGQFAVSVRRESSPFTSYVWSGTISTTTGVDSIAVTTISLSADAARAGLPIGNKWTRPGVTGITGPFFGLYSRAHVPSQTTGWSYHTLVYRGGQSLRTMANDLINSSDTALTYLFSDMRRLQGSTKTVCFVINSGLNDRSETLTSVGPNTVADADSPEAYIDNLTAIVQRIEGIWSDNSWDRSELFFLFMPSHPVSDPDDVELSSYRTAVAAYTPTVTNAAFLNIEALYPQASIGYASSGADTSHLTQASYEAISAALVAEFA